MAIDWMTIDKAKGNGDITLGVSANANAATSSRNARIKITSTDGSIVKYVSVIQEGKEADYLNVSVTGIAHNYTASTGPAVITITSNMSWTLEYPDWISVSPTSGNGDGELNVLFTENTTGKDRMGAITVKGATITKYITVGQYKEIKDHHLAIEPTTLTFDEYGGELSFNVYCDTFWGVTSPTSWTIIGGEYVKDWLTLDKTSGYCSAKVKVKVPSSEIARDIKITVSVNGSDNNPSKTVWINQEVNDVLPTPTNYQIIYVSRSNTAQNPYHNTDGYGVWVDATTNKNAHLNKMVSNVYYDTYGIWTFTEEVEKVAFPDYALGDVYKIKLPSCTHTIGEKAFSSSSLEYLYLTNNRTNIMLKSFYHCKTFKKLDFTKVIYMDDYCFTGCTSLETPILSENLTYLGDFAFAGCTNINGKINATGKLRVIEPEAFAKTNITEITLSNSVVTINHSFGGCKNLKKVNINEGLERITETSFYECEKLTTITLPSTLKNIDGQAFAHSGITEMFCKATTAPTLWVDGTHPDEASALSYMKKNGTLHYPSGSDYSTWLAQLGSGWTGVADL